MMILYDSLTSFDYVNNFFELHHLVRPIILDQYFVRVNIELLFLRPRPPPHFDSNHGLSSVVVLIAR